MKKYILVILIIIIIFGVVFTKHLFLAEKKLKQVKQVPKELIIKKFILKSSSSFVKEEWSLSSDEARILSEQKIRLKNIKFKSFKERRKYFSVSADEGLIKKDQIRKNILLLKNNIKGVLYDNDKGLKFRSEDFCWYESKATLELAGPVVIEKDNFNITAAHAKIFLPEERIILRKIEMKICN